MARMPAFRFTALDNSVLSERVRRHIGARRFAFNRCLAALKDGLDEKRRRPEAEVPWSGYSLINWWNGWKRSKDAGCVFAVDSSGDAELVEQGLSWRNEVAPRYSKRLPWTSAVRTGPSRPRRKARAAGNGSAFRTSRRRGRAPSHSGSAIGSLGPVAIPSASVRKGSGRSLSGDRHRGGPRRHAPTAASASTGTGRDAPGKDLFGHGVAAAGTDHPHAHLRALRPAPRDTPSARKWDS